MTEQTKPEMLEQEVETNEEEEYTPPNLTRKRAKIVHHTEVVIDPFQGTDEDYDRLLATTRKAAFKTMPYLVTWVRKHLEDRHNTEITVTAVMGPIALTTIVEKELFTNNKDDVEVVQIISTGVAAMVYKLLSGSKEATPESLIVKPNTAEAVEILK